MYKRQTVKIFISSKMGNPGTQYHTYRQALINWIETEYPFLEVDAFEDIANPENYKSWEINAIKDAVLFIALIVDDRTEVTFEIEQAIVAKNPVLLFFFPNEKRAPKTWNQFAKSKGVKSKKASTWRDLIKSVRGSIDDRIIGLFKETRGQVSYEPPQPMEEI